MRKKNGIWKRTSAMLLVVLMLVGIIGQVPMQVRAATYTDSETVIGAYNQNGNKYADAPSVNNWKDVFQLGNAANTEYAGGIWTDKSVFTSVGDYLEATDENVAGTEAYAAVENGLKLDDSNNFLVALSAIASTKSIKGYTSIPTDTIFVLDMSSSMNTANSIDDLAKAADEAVTTLLNVNYNNRIGVVFYSGHDDGMVLLPLDRYSTTATGESKYLELYRSNNKNGIRVVNGVTGEKNKNVARTGDVYHTGTFTQDGIYMAMRELEKADKTVTSGVQAGMERMPIIVLMTDGEPTVMANDFTGNAGALPNLNGRDSVQSWVSRDFMSQLSAGYAKYMLEEGANKYLTHDLLFYTLGLGDIDDLPVLDPTQSTETNNYWNDFLAGDRRVVDNGQELNVNATAEALDGFMDALEADKTVRNKYRSYVNGYFTAKSNDQLQAAFQKIVEEIILQSMYYPTHVDNQDPNNDGFLEFVDHIGKNMEVKDIKGIQLGEKLYTGATFAKMVTEGMLGTVENPSDIGNNLIWAIQYRLGIEDVTQARAIITVAWNNGLLYYNSDTDYGNSYGWYTDDTHQFLGVWDGLPQDQTKTPANGAKYTVKSYAFYDAVGDDDSHRKTDMMYATIQVRTNIANGDTTVIGRLPASLLPLIEYEVELNSETLTDVKSLTTKGAEHPTRLIYEVGLSSRIDLLDIEGTAPQPNYLHPDENGNYVFYTNEWPHDEHSSSQDTTVHFEPSHQNERYYFHEDSLLYTAQSVNSVYNGEAAPAVGTTYYRLIYIYQNGANGATCVPTFVPIADEVLAMAIANGAVKQSDKGWYVEKGEIFRAEAKAVVKKDILNAAGEVLKKGNWTETLDFVESVRVIMPNTDNDGQNPYYLSADLGNNGKLVFNPPEGIKLDKNVDATLPGTGTYTFTLTAIKDGVAAAGAKTILITENVNGERTEDHNRTFNEEGKLTVSLGVDDVMYIFVEPGVCVEITENMNGHYRVSEIKVDDVVKDKAEVDNITSGDFTEVVFTNTAITGGDLVISKHVNETGFDNHKELNFEFTVQITGDVQAGKTFTAFKSGTTGTAENMTLTVVEEGGVLYLKHIVDGVAKNIFLSHNRNLTIKELPDGAQVTVTEINLPNGFTSNQTNNTAPVQTIVVGETKSVAFGNSYEAKPTLPANISITGTKKLNSTDWSGGTFTFELQRANADGSFTAVSQQTVTFGSDENADKTFAFSMEAETYSAAGTYSYRVVEVVPATPAGGIIYDPTNCYFDVVVTDDGSGQLKITDVLEGADTTVTETEVEGTKSWTVSVEFVNDYVTEGAAEAVIRIDKTIRSEYGVTIPPAGFQFDLFEANEEFTIKSSNPVATSAVTSSAGKANVSQTYTKTGTYYYVLREKVPANPIDGVTYTDTEYYVEVVVDSIHGEFTIVVTVFDRAGKVVSTVANPASAALERTEAPKFVPAEGEVTVGTVVNLECDTAGAAIYYKLDSGEYTLYDPAIGIVLTGPVTIYAYAEAAGMQKSAVVSAVYTIADAQTNQLQVQFNEVSAPVTQSDNVVVAEIPSVPFVNEYKPQPVTLKIPISGSKTMVGREQLDNEFTFALYEANANFAITVSEPIVTVKNHAKDAGVAAGFSFPNRTYDRVGTHYYVIKELVPENAANNGITYDTSEYHVTVTVTADNVTGKLLANATIENASGKAAAIEFTNSYQPKPTQATFLAKKRLTSIYPLQSGAFSFKLERFDETKWTDLGTVSNGAPTDRVDTDETITTEAPIEVTRTYTKAGTYYYRLTEQELEAVTGGMTYESKVLYVKVEVTDQVKDETGAVLSYDGSLEATVSYCWATANEENFQGLNYQPSGENGVDPTFVNVYTVTPVSATFGGEKTLNGALFTTPSGVEGKSYGDLVTIELYSATSEKDRPYVQGALMETVGLTNGKFAFRVGPFSDLGDYRYIIKETVNTGDPLMEIDTTIYYVQVNVYDNHSGQLQTEITVTDMDGNKLDGVTTGTLNFTNEVKPEPLTATDLNLGGIKVFNGTMTAGKFTFELYETAEDFAVAEEEQPILTATNDADGKFVFAEEMVEDVETGESATTSYLTFSQAGTYYFVIKEQLPEGVDADNKLYGITYDTSEYQVTVVVTETTVDGRATLSVAKTIVKKGDDTTSVEEAVFTNTYGAVSADGSGVILSASKTLTGRDLANGEFTFELYKATVSDDNTVTLGDKLQTKTNVGTGVSFDKLEKENFPSAGEYYFVIKEALPVNENGKTLTEQDGVTYDTTEFVVKVVVIDDGKGNLTISDPTYAKIEGGKMGVAVTGASFANEYHADPLNIPVAAQVQLEGSKFLGNKTLEADQFTFQMYVADADWQIDTTKTALTAKNDANGKIVFTNADGANEDFVVTQAGTYYYIIKEVNDNQAQVSYDGSEYRVTVVVKDDGKGALVIDSVTMVKAVTVDETTTTTSAEKIVFNNTYNPTPVPVILEGTKLYKDAAGNSLTMTAGQFTFELYETGSDYSIPEGAQPVTITNSADGSFQFDLSLDTAGNYHYVVKEKAGSDSLVNYDGSVYEILVTVSNDNGVLSAVVTIQKNDVDVDAITFTNVKNPPPWNPGKITVELEVEKYLKNLSSGKFDLSKFQFELLDENGKVVDTKYADKNGDASFTLSFDKGDVGKTFTYILREVDTDLENVIYSTKEYKIEIEILRSGDDLVARIKVDGIRVTSGKALTFEFTNIYRTPSDPIVPPDPGNKDPDRPSSPDTGDADTFRWILLLAVGCVGFVVTAITGLTRRRRR